MAVFETVITPDAAGAFGHWRQRLQFGTALPSARSSGFSHLEVDDVAEAGLFAAFAGKISTHEPTGFLRAAVKGFEAQSPGSTSLTLYLEANTTKAAPEWHALTTAIAQRFSTTIEVAASAAGVVYLIYRNVAADAAKAALGPRIKTRPARAAGAAIDDVLWQRFVAGEGFVAVQAGDRIGAAGPAYLLNTQPNRLQVSVGLRTQFGMFDPGTFYSLMTSTAGVQSPAHAAALATLFTPALPLIDPTRPVDAVGNDRLWSWSALVEYKRAKNLKYSEWRRLGDLQKQKYLTHLLARVRPASAPPNTVRFDFDGDDMSNVFQLEAVTEFYMNLREPWDSAAQPTPPGAGYTIVNFLSLYGAAARVNGTELTLDDSFDVPRDMDRIATGRDTLWLEGETVRPRNQFRIMDVPGADKVTVDVAPQLAGATSAWRMFDSPTIVQIDAFGARVNGAQAVAGAAARTIELQALSAAQLEALQKVNPYETISFATVSNGAADARLTKAPTVSAVTLSATLELDRAIALPGGAGSAWAIPSGVGGVQGYLRKKPTRPASKAWGWDHYDGMLFVVAGGEIRCAFPFSSYTSRMLDRRGKPTKYHSSIKGNRRYHFGSVFSRNLYINVSFSVIDPEAVPRGRRHTTTVAGNRRNMVPDVPLNNNTLLGKWPHNIYFIQPAPPRFLMTWTAGANPEKTALIIKGKTAALAPTTPSPYWALAYDGVREARHYFKPTFDADIAAPGAKVPQGKNALGKGGIRIHIGEPEVNGSQGCQVSTYFMRMRVALIKYHAESNETYYEENKADPRLDRIREMQTEAHKPPAILEYQRLTKNREALQKRVKAAFADPLAVAIDEVLRSGADDASRLETLRALIVHLEELHREAEDSADSPSQDVIIPVLERLTDEATEEDVQALVQWAAKHAEFISSLNRQIAEIDKQLADECASWGWDDAMHGNYWLVRPDERAV